MSDTRVLFYVQHLLGIGHLKRAGTIARAIKEHGIDVTLVSGGGAVPVFDSSGLDFVQLDPVKASDRTFSGLMGPDGTPLSDEIKAARRDKLRRLFDDMRPTVIIIELFPFGRRQLRFELIPLLDAALESEPRPTIISSVRDVLVEKNRPERDQEMVDTVEKYFDYVLVHGDPTLIPFEKTFSPAVRIADRLRYTGYVVDHAEIGARQGDQGTGEVIVSSGGGATGEKLLRMALAARPNSVLGDKPWRLLAGHNMADDDFAAISAAAAQQQNVVVERARQDFVTLLRNCRLSISQGGYNTVMEVLATGAPAVTVPYAGGNETEQTVRGRLLAARGLLQSIPEDELTASKLIAAISEAADFSPPDNPGIDMNGAEATAAMIAQLRDGGEIL